MKTPVLDWNTPAGLTITALCQACTIPATITVFGSAPLQMAVEKNLLSQDVDVFSDVDLSLVVEANHLGVGQREVGVQVCHEESFHPYFHALGLPWEEWVKPVRRA